VTGCFQHLELHNLTGSHERGGLTLILLVIYPAASKVYGPTMNVHSHFLGSLGRKRVHSALAWLLLLTIGYGAIVEAAHSHGFSSSRPSQLISVSDGSDSQSSYQSHSSHNDCSLCQFQRQLFGSFVHVVLIAHTPQQIAFVSEETVSYLSTLTLPASGRSPPLS